MPAPTRYAMRRQRVRPIYGIGPGGELTIETPKQSKYRNQKCKMETNDGQILKFDSARELKRFRDLNILAQDGISVTRLQRQVPYELIPAQYDDDKLVERAVIYVADFTYFDHGHLVVEDSKGFKTPEYIIKRKLMLHVHNIRITEV